MLLAELNEYMDRYPNTARNNKHMMSQLNPCWVRKQSPR